MSDSTLSAASYESKTEEEAKDGFGSSFVKMWLDAIDLSTKEEDDWRKKAEKACEEYRGGKDAKTSAFNIFHSNIETICPAIYNSTPVPDVRRRYGDDDAVAKIAADIIERAISYSIDNYDFSETVDRFLRDGEITGRGIPRVRYKPTFDKDGLVAYEEVTCDYVPWKWFRRGPATTWQDMPWIAFGDFLTKEAIADLVGDAFDPKLVPLTYIAGDDGKTGKASDQDKSIFKRGLVWQIWDRDNRRVISICPDYPDRPLKVISDPLKLTGFFPVPRPYTPVISTGSLTPVIPYEIYEGLIGELQTVSTRISRLTKQLRPRGGYGGNADDVKAITEAEDGELVPLTDASMIAQIANSGGLEKFITWFPMEPTVKALAQLVGQRDLLKQSIYEVTGLSDIIRGSTHASETATAQQLKSQWGSLRIQRRQQEVARIVRDLFRMKAEIISQRFAWSTLSSMTGINVPSNVEREAARAAVAQFQQAAAQAQAVGQQPPAPPADAEKIQEIANGPSREEVEEIMRSDINRSYRIDIESDSTIRGDMSRNQEMMGNFLQGTAQFAQAMGPLVQQNPAALKPVMEVYASFVRTFKLGKSAEDAIEKVIKAAESAGQSGPQEDPKAQAEQAKVQAEQQRIALQMQADQQKHQLEMEKMQAEAQRDLQKLDIDRQRLELAASRNALSAARIGVQDGSSGYVPQEMSQQMPAANGLGY